MDHRHGQLETRGRLSAGQIAAVTRLVDDATEADGVRPLSEHVMLHLRYGGDEPTRNLLLWSSSNPTELAGYAHLDVTDPVEGPSAEIVVAPALRGQGLGRVLLEAATENTDGRLRLWAHGDLPEASALAQRLGFTRARVLWQMRRSLFAPLPQVELPDGVRIRTFEPGADDAAWLAVNARAFADHPEQGVWTPDDLHRRMSESWFDPQGFFLAERGREIVGFHWTKVHGGTVHARTGHQHGHEHEHEHGHEAIGEVYVVGVDPAARGLGLGRQLTVVGLRYLRGRGLNQVMLYVDATNAGAIGLYESLGFGRWDTDVLFRRG